MVLAFRVLEFFFLVPFVVFASINSYEAWSCTAVWNIVLLLLLAVLLCIAEWQFLYVTFFENSSLGDGILHDIDMLFAPLVVGIYAISVSMCNFPVCRACKDYLCNKDEEKDKTGTGNPVESNLEPGAENV
jgi:hypothetical protein